MIEHVSNGPLVLIDAGFPDIELLCDTVRLWDLDLRPLKMDVTAEHAGAVIQKIGTSGGYGYCALNGSMDQFGSAPPDVFTFVVRSVGTGSIWWRSLDTVEGEVLVYKPGSEVRCVNGAGFAIQTISIDEARLKAICESLKVVCPNVAALPEVFRLSPEVLHATRAKLELCRNGPSGAFDAVVRELSEVLVATWVAQHSTRYKPRPSQRARDRAIRNCLEYLESSDLASVDMAQLRSRANVGKRTLEYALREKFQVTPNVFLRSLRLSRVRNMLQQAQYLKTSIGDMAASQGMWHHGRFSQDYKKMYGETPQQTRLRRLAG